MTGKIKNIIFDMGGVLIDLDREAAIRGFAAIGYAEAGQLLTNWLQKGIFAELEKGAVTPAEFYDYIRAHSTASPSDQMIEDALNMFLVSLPTYRLDMLLELRRRFKVFMLSNTNAVMMPHIKREYFGQQGLSFEDYFDHAYLSYEMGTMKPGEEIFLELLGDAGIEAPETLFLDDGEANIATAARLGFATYLVRPGEEYLHIFEHLG